jgi:hypothetical protein
MRVKANGPIVLRAPRALFWETLCGTSQQNYTVPIPFCSVSRTDRLKNASENSTLTLGSSKTHLPRVLREPRKEIERLCGNSSKTANEPRLLCSCSPTDCSAPSGNSCRGRTDGRECMTPTDSETKPSGGRVTPPSRWQTMIGKPRFPLPLYQRTTRNANGEVQVTMWGPCAVHAIRWIVVLILGIGLIWKGATAPVVTETLLKFLATLKWSDRAR